VSPELNGKDSATDLDSIKKARTRLTVVNVRGVTTESFPSVRGFFLENLSCGASLCFREPPRLSESATGQP